MYEKKTAVFYALLAAALFGISCPAAKLLIAKISPVLMAGFLYLGAGTGMFLVNLLRRRNFSLEAKITKKEIPYVIGMIVLDIAAPICLLLGLSLSNPANVSLLSNFEIVATSLIAFCFFKESLGWDVVLSLILITAASMLISIEDFSSFSFSLGSLFVILACLCWGMENNCTRMLSLKDPLQVVILKGFGSGLGSLLLAFLLKECRADYFSVILTLILGFFAYGLSIFFYIKAQRDLGAARTSAYYAVAPFIGVILSFFIFQERLTLSFLTASGFMLAGVYLGVAEKHKHYHIHERQEHEHRHNHTDGHHQHFHAEDIKGEHSHRHIHEREEHSHVHTPDLHHIHEHN